MDYTKKTSLQNVYWSHVKHFEGNKQCRTIWNEYGIKWFVEAVKGEKISLFLPM